MLTWIRFYLLHSTKWIQKQNRKPDGKKVLRLKIIVVLLQKNGMQAKAIALLCFIEMYPIFYHGYDYFHCRLLVGCAFTKIPGNQVPSV